MSDITNIILQQNKVKQENEAPVIPIVVDNMVGEQAYLDSYFLPIAEKDNLQNALDTHGSVRLDQGDYGGAKITMTDNQSLYGHPRLTTIPDIDIAAGSTNIHIEAVSNTVIDFLAGSPITNCQLTTINSSFIRSVGGQIENNKFYDILKTSINFDCSASGYFRNNEYYKHMIHTLSPQLILRGNTTTPSYGNVHVWTNFLTPNGDAAILETIEDIHFIGLDAEGWNLRFEQTVGALLYARDIGRLVVTDFGGSGGYAGETEEYPPFDVEADDFIIFNSAMNNDAKFNNPPRFSIARGNTNITEIRGTSRNIYQTESGTGLSFKATWRNFESFDDDFTLANDVVVTPPLTNTTYISKLTNQFTPPVGTMIPRPVFEEIPNPTGENWATERVGKPDSRDFIQSLIDANNVAELPEGIYYIGSTLDVNGNTSSVQGVIGAGSGKTAIVGLTDDFPLFTLNQTSDQSLQYIFAYITLQGGNAGIYSPDEIMLISTNNWKYVTFRDQENGIHLRWNFGLDNNYFDHLNFINCGKGIFQDTHPILTFEDSSYVDKTVFYKSQFINCGVGASLKASRGDNLNSFIDCNFDGNDFPIDIRGNNFAKFVNCDIKNSNGGLNGDLTRGSGSWYNCEFTNNTCNFIFGGTGGWVEGCTFNDTMPLFSNQVHLDGSQFVLNSTSQGSLGGASSNNNGTIINSSFANDTQYNKFMVDIDDNVVTPLIDAPVNPYPQFYVKR